MDKVFLKKQFKISNFILLLTLLIVSMILIRKITMFFVLTLIASVIVYFNYYIRLPFDLSPVLFFSLVITREFSFIFSAVFIIISGIIPMILAGGTFDHTTIFYTSLIIGINYLSSFFLSNNFIITAILISVLHHVIAAIGSIIFGTDPRKEIINLGTKILVDLFYILSFSELLFSIIK
ncbi:hypothetical protein GF327_00715 [Candidatus Woesearchaeota archaeon]|nr:hypothetical protein [Candidatus Woesearchaeota archaeon]